MYSKIGISSDSPSGYSPEPTTFTTLSISDVSYPEKGIYI